VTDRGRTTIRWWLVLPWVVAVLVLVGRVVAHRHDSGVLDDVSPFGVVVVGIGAGMLWRGPRTVRSRWAAGLMVAAGALMWFADVNGDRSYPGQPHRGTWFALGLSLWIASFGLVLAADACARSERDLWVPSGFLRPR